MRLHEARSPLRCVVCHGDLDGAGVACAGCGARAHLDCWTDLGRCTSLGCGVSPRPRIVLGPPAPLALAPPAVARGRPLARLLVVALGILGVLAPLVWINLQGQSVKSPHRRVQADMKALLDAADLYKVDTGAYPPSLDALWIRPANARRWGPEPYLEEYPPKDPWGNDYRYRLDGGRRPEIVSYGEDGQPGCACPGCDLSSRTRERDAE